MDPLLTPSWGFVIPQIPPISLRPPFALGGAHDYYFFSFGLLKAADSRFGSASCSLMLSQ